MKEQDFIPQPPVDRRLDSPMVERLRARLVSALEANSDDNSSVAALREGRKLNAQSDIGAYDVFLGICNRSGLPSYLIGPLQSEFFE